MPDTYFYRVHRQTPTRFWINNVTRDQARLAIENGAVGCTQNPAYTWKMLTHETEKDYAFGLLDQILREEKDDDVAMMRLQRALIGGVAQIFKPIYDASRGKAGFVSIQGDPFRENSRDIVDFARYDREAGENIMVKIPVVDSAMEAIETLVKERVPINATECMTVRQVLEVCARYERASRDLVNPAPLYYSVITGIYDEHIQKTVAARKLDVSGDAVWQAGMAVAKKAYALVRERGYHCHYIGGGARGLHHFTEMVGADCVVTINWTGTADKLLEQDPPVVSRFFDPVSLSVIDELTEKVEDFRRAYYINGITLEECEDFGPVVLFRSSFESAWKNCLEAIRTRR